MNELEASTIPLITMAKVNKSLIGLAEQLPSRPGVKIAERMCEVRQYDASTYFEGCVDVETVHGRAFSFWIELGIDCHGWRVSASVSETAPDGQHVIEQYPVTVSILLNDLELITSEAVQWLANTAMAFSFE
jgi:hypothetical protein